MRLRPLLALAALVMSACGAPPRPDVGTDVVEVHRSPSCSCCAEYEEYLTSEGFRVETVLHADDLGSFKEAVGVPPELGSCHTTLVGGYFVEGHVPAAYIRRLLSEAPDVIGIALPGMPPGSPGMAGTATEPLIVYAVGEEGVWVFGEQ